MGKPVGYTTRASDRVAIAILVRIFGSDVDGRAYVEEARTQVVSRNGALIVVDRKLIPQEEVVLHVKATGKESPAQIVGQVRRELEGFVYGIRVLEPRVNLWDIKFPPLSESSRALLRTLLECAKCHLREVVYFEEFEAEVFQAHRFIHHDCQRCRESTIWKKVDYETPPESIDAPPKSVGSPSPSAAAVQTDSLPPSNRRRHPRIKCQFRACIRYKQHYDEEILEVENISRGGVCFATSKCLVPGTKFDIAIPYSPGTANIFVPAQVVRQRPIPGKNLYEIGAAYLRG